jgi:aryl-alcohol dehydrogenase-like predicted oxidoreductase
MQTRPFGATGLMCSAIGFGCGRTGGLLINGPLEDRRRAMRAALDGGINWFDTAEAYGSEQALGELLAEVPEDPHVSTKVTIDPARPDYAGQVVAHGEACLKRLGRERVTVMQFHNRVDPYDADGKGFSAEQMLAPGGPIEGLERLRDAGRAQFIGFTALGDAPSLMEVIESGRLNSAQVFYNFVNPSADREMPAGWIGQRLTGVLDACERRGMGTIGIRVLVGGVVPEGEAVGRVSMMTKETDKDTEIRKTEAALRALGTGHGSRAQTGLRFALACKRLSICMVGIGKPEHVDAALEAEARGPLPADAVAALEPLYQSNFGLG